MAKQTNIYFHQSKVNPHYTIPFSITILPTFHNSNDFWTVNITFNHDASLQRRVYMKVTVRKNISCTPSIYKK